MIHHFLMLVVGLALLCPTPVGATDVKRASKVNVKGFNKIDGQIISLRQSLRDKITCSIKYSIFSEQRKALEDYETTCRKAEILRRRVNAYAAVVDELNAILSDGEFPTDRCRQHFEQLRDEYQGKLSSAPAEYEAAKRECLAKENEVIRNNENHSSVDGAMHQALDGACRACNYALPESEPPSDFGRIETTANESICWSTRDRDQHPRLSFPSVTRTAVAADESSSCDQKSIQYNRLVEKYEDAENVCRSDHVTHEEILFQLSLLKWYYAYDTYDNLVACNEIHENFREKYTTLAEESESDGGFDSAAAAQCSNPKNMANIKLRMKKGHNQMCESCYTGLQMFLCENGESLRR